MAYRTILYNSYSYIILRFFASSVGNAMEMYDFAIFGALVDIIGKDE